MKRQYGMYYHTFYDDPELTSHGISDINSKKEDSFRDFQEISEKFFVCSSSLLRSQETAYFMTRDMLGTSNGPVINNKIYVLPYIDEIGSTTDNRPMDDTRRRSLVPSYSDIGAYINKDLYEPGPPNPKFFVDWLKNNWDRFVEQQDNGYIGGRKIPGSLIADVSEGYFSQEGGDRDDVISLYIVSHSGFLEAFMREYANRTISGWNQKIKNLDTIRVTINIDAPYKPRVDVRGRRYYMEAVPRVDPACTEDVKAGRCRKQVCKAVVRDPGPPAAVVPETPVAPLPNTNSNSNVASVVGMSYPEECYDVQTLLERARTSSAKYKDDILPVARKLLDRPGFEAAGKRLETLYKPGWFTTRSNKRLPEDLGEVLPACGITVEPVVRRKEPGEGRYGEPLRGGSRRTRRRSQRGQTCRRTRGRRLGRRLTRRR